MATASRRVRVVLLTAVVIASAAACAPATSGPQSISITPPYCPFDIHLAMYGGDSIAGHWPGWITLPANDSAFNTARGGSSFGGNYTSDPTMDTIGARVLTQLNTCGNNIGAVAISGGLNDLTEGQAPSVAINAIQSLDATLYARGVHTVMLKIHPIPQGTPTELAVQAHRQAVNTWMSTPGNLHATVVDCTSVLESSPGSDTLNYEYWTFENIVTVDPVHMNDAGYAAMGHCAQTAISNALQH